MGGGGGPDAPDVVGAARVEAEAARQAAQEELWGNRPNQYGPMSSTLWETTMIDANTGQPIRMLPNGTWVPVGWDGTTAAANAPPRPYVTPVDELGSGRSRGANIARRNRELEALRAWEAQYGSGGGNAIYSGPEIDPVTSWNQTTTLNPEWQEIVDQQRDLIGQQTQYRSDQVADWSSNPLDYNFSGNLSPTIGTGDLAQFGTTNPNMGAQDWRQFGTTGQTIGADQWQDLGYTNQTIGADDWRQFGTSNPLLTGSTYDERYGGQNQDPTGGYGAHGMEGSDWDTIQYAPEAIRRQAEQQTLDFMYGQLDPQWDTRRNDLEVQLANQGLQWGDAAYDNAMAAFDRSKNTAYAGARNQALADSRAEAQMLWDQEMQRSTQKNFLTQSDIDNIYRARQSNIQNYQQNRSQEVDDYLAYQQAAFGQDLASRQQQLDANLGYGQAAFGQDLAGRQQALDAQLGYGREAYQQDYQTRQQQLDANRLYSQQAFDQDLASRQAAISNYLNYGREGFQQGLSQQQLALQEAQIQEQLMQNRYGLVNPGETYATVDAALS